MSLGEKLKLALTFRRASNQYERDTKMQYDWTKSVKAGVLQILTLCGTAALTAAVGVASDNEAIKGILARAGVGEAYAAVLLLAITGGARVAQNWLKHNGPPNGLPVVLALLASGVSAQEAIPEPIRLTLHGGAMQFAERGQPDKRDFVYRVTLTIPAPSKVTVFGRADYTRTQDGGDLTDPKTFRSVEALLGARKDLGQGFSIMAYSGASWARDKKVDPADPRLWTLAAGLRYTVAKRGYVIASAGHHGPVGGSAFLGSLVYEIKDGASWFGDIAIPLDASRFALRPYTIKAGISAQLWARKF